MYKSELLKELSSLGFIKDIAHPDKLDEIVLKEKITLYCGADLTAKSLHVGNLMQIMFLRKFLKYSHNIIFLLGGATTKIGDPSGKDDIRKILTDTEIEENKNGILADFGQFIDANSPQVKVLNNMEWLGKFSYIEFLRDVGMHFTVNRMLAMESVKQRLLKQNPMNFIEFNYMLMQGYDFAYLNKHYNCILQIGGSDQWGNITEGMELCGRMNKQQAFAITSPLITRADGQKMGKSLGGAISLSPKLTSSFEYFQYFRNMADEDVPKMLKYYTDLPLTEIEKLSNLKGKEVNEAKKILAFEATKLCRGEMEAIKALQEAENVFAQNNAPEGEGLIIRANIGDSLLKIMLEFGAIKSMQEGKTLVSQGAVKIDDKLLENFSFTFGKKSEIKLSVGKKKVYKIIVS